MAERPTFTPVFEETEGAIRDRMLANPDLAKWRREPGDFMHDAAVGPNPAEVQLLQIGLDTTLKNSIPQYAEDAWLDYHLATVGETRLPATPNKRTLRITADAGVTLAAGKLLSTVVIDDAGEPLLFAVDQAITWAAAGPLDVAVTCQIAGAIGNLAAGSQFVMQPTVLGVRSVVDLGTVTLGKDRESDADAWARYDFKAKNPDTGGNKNDYIRWIKALAYIGDVKVIPRWNGTGTVKVVIVGTDFAPASVQVVADTQAYIDPSAEGLGNGKAPAGAAVTVAAAAALQISVAVATLDITPGFTRDGVLAAFTDSLAEYIKGLVFETLADGSPAPVVYNKVAAMFTFTPGVSNFAGLTVNGGAVDITPAVEEAPVVGGVTLP